MYRADGDEVISYTVEDLLLFKESPFASWMERLTLENPLHGIVPDESSEPANMYSACGNVIDPESVSAHRHSVESVQWTDLVGHRSSPTVRAPRLRRSLEGVVAAGDDIVVVKKMDDIQRRKATLDAMRSGASLIVNAQLSVGFLSGDVDLLVRSSGLSELGNYLYLPCDTSDRERPHWELALCYAADLLHSMQGTLPSQLLGIRDERELLSLRTEDNIYHYRAVKQSFMTAQSSFRKHCMPNPEDSVSFGRWFNCANDVMKRRAIFPSGKGSNTEDTGVEAALQSGVSGLSVKAFELRGAPSPRLRSVPDPNEALSYVDLDRPRVHRNVAAQQRFNNTLMTSNGSEF